jgi:hypothetical protein
LPANAAGVRRRKPAVRARGRLFMIHLAGGRGSK